jgi:hypothetical protein
MVCRDVRSDEEGCFYFVVLGVSPPSRDSYMRWDPDKQPRYHSASAGDTRNESPPYLGSLLVWVLRGFDRWISRRVAPNSMWGLNLNIEGRSHSQRLIKGYWWRFIVGCRLNEASIAERLLWLIIERAIIAITRSRRNLSVNGELSLY